VKEVLPKTLDLANALGAKIIICFGFHRAGLGPGSAPAAVIDTLGEAAERAASAGIILAMETEEGYWADTGERTRQVVEQVHHPALRVNWDPGNAYCAGERPYPSGYAALRGRIQHVHFKDARRLPDGGAEFVTNGEIDWQGQIQALMQDKYDGYVSIETHLRPKIAGAKAAFDRLSRLIAEAQQGA
jgi:sugar phosphate isomerase/epimerase